MARRQGDFTVVIKKSRRLHGPMPTVEKSWIAGLTLAAETKPGHTHADGNKPELHDARALAERMFMRPALQEPNILLPITPAIEKPRRDHLSRPPRKPPQIKPKVKPTTPLPPVAQQAEADILSTALPMTSRQGRRLRRHPKLDRADLPSGQRWRARLPEASQADALPTWKRLKCRRTARRSANLERLSG